MWHNLWTTLTIFKREHAKEVTRTNQALSTTLKVTIKISSGTTISGILCGHNARIQSEAQTGG